MTKDIIFSPKNLNRILIDRKPSAYAELLGNDGKKEIHGTVSLYQTPLGILVKANIDGLPPSEKADRYHVAFDGRHRTVTLPCTQNGSCQILTASFSMGDVLEHTVDLLTDRTGLTLASGKLHVAHA